MSRRVLRRHRDRGPQRRHRHRPAGPPRRGRRVRTVRGPVNTHTGTAPAGGLLLSGRRLLVVGGGQQTYGIPDAPIGIGRAICVLAAREGACIAVADIDPAAARDTAEAITREGNAAEAFTADGADDAGVAGLIAGVLTRFGELDGLVMSLGIASGDHL